MRDALEPFGDRLAVQCVMCEERPAVGYYGDAEVCQECYDEAEAPFREIARLTEVIKAHHLDFGEIDLILRKAFEAIPDDEVGWRRAERYAKALTEIRGIVRPADTGRQGTP